MDLRDKDALDLERCKAIHDEMIRKNQAIYVYNRVGEKVGPDMPSIDEEEGAPPKIQPGDYHREGAYKTWFLDAIGKGPFRKRTIHVDDDLWITPNNPASYHNSLFGGFDNDYNEIFDFLISHGKTSCVVEWDNPAKISLYKLERVLDLAEKKGMKVEFGKTLEGMLDKLEKNKENPNAFLEDKDFLKACGDKKEVATRAIKRLYKEYKGAYSHIVNPGSFVKALNQAHFAKRKEDLAKNYNDKMGEVIAADQRYQLGQNQFDLEGPKKNERDAAFASEGKAAADDAKPISEQIVNVNKYADHLDEHLQKLDSIKKQVNTSLDYLSGRLGAVQETATSGDELKNLQKEYKERNHLNEYIRKYVGEADAKGEAKPGQPGLLPAEYAALKTKINALEIKPLDEACQTLNDSKAGPLTDTQKKQKDDLEKLIVRVKELKEKAANLSADPVKELRVKNFKFNQNLEAKEAKINAAIAVTAEPPRRTP